MFKNKRKKVLMNLISDCLKMDLKNSSLFQRHAKKGV